MTVAALVLAAAVLVAPGSPRRRLIPRSNWRSRSSATGWGRGLAVSLSGALVLALVAPLPAVVAGAMVGATLVMRRRAANARALRAVEAVALQGALSVLVGELRVGAHPVAAFETAAAEVDGQVAGSLRAVAARARLGADVAAGLRSIAAHSTLAGHWERLSACWELAQTHGLAVVALMRAAERDIVERERFTSRVIAGTAGARATAAILAGLPVLGVGLGHLIGAEPVQFLLSDGVGGWLLFIGVGLACVGLWWSDRIIGRVLT